MTGTVPTWLRRRRTLAIAFLLVALAALLWAGWQLSRARCHALFVPALCHVETQQNLVALTFDDGPTQRGVDTLLPILAAHGARATFFLTGDEMAQRPQLAPRLIAAGHEIGNHSYSHVRMVGHLSGFYRDEIARTDVRIRQAGGTPGLFRPPYGKKLIGLPWVLRDMDRKMVMWDVEDPVTKEPAAFARQVIAQALPGSIILIHAMYPANETARRALPMILDGLAAKGLRAVTVGQLLAAAATD